MMLLPFFRLLDQHFDLDSFIPDSFFCSFIVPWAVNTFTGFLAALILQKLFSIPTEFLLILFLNLCREFREFCGFQKIPDAPLFTRFKQDFLPFIEDFFLQLVDFTEPICQAIDSSLAQMLTFDTSGIEPYVTENNPKTLTSLIRRLKSYYKDKPDVDPYQMAYALMPSQDAKQLYINGHFCYADKFAILTNGLGIIRHINFLDDDFKQAHPELPVEKKSDSPDKDKSIGDSSSLKPVLSDFLLCIPSSSLTPFYVCGGRL
ncbi:transposase [Enterocloster bolteae]|uniref:transposase n=1 Tax=Enterocloster bolteae TaxID=208479 RepID=UPI002FE6D379